MPNPSPITLRTWRGPGAKSGWHVQARMPVRKGTRIFNARYVLSAFRNGDSMAYLASEQCTSVEVIEQILRLMMGRERH
jgi:hypothetical protein